MDTSNFGGIAVISFESRLAGAMARGIRAQGGRPVSAPSLREVPLAENAEILSFGEKLFAGKIDALVCMTGVGTKILLETLAARWDLPGIIDRLSRVTVVARGPKPAQVLRDNGIPVTLVIPEPDTTAEIIEALDQSPKGLSLDGKTVAVQEHGASNARLVQALKERGAQVLQVPVYRWALPQDTAPLLAGIREVIGGRVQVALFTNAAQVDHVLRFASGEGLEKPLREAMKKLVIASIGPSTSEGLAEQGFPVDFEPSRPKMELLVEEAARSAAELIRQKREGPLRPHVKPEHLRADAGAVRAGAAARRDSPFLKACRREPAPVTPVWLMRQAGRYMKSYRDIRGKVSFLELCRNRELAAEVAVAAAEKLKADAAILFSDILLIVEPLGLALEYGPDSGPEITGRVAGAADVEALREIEPAESLGYVFDAVRLTRAALAPELPLIGFSGAPFTLAAYVIEGGGSRSFLKTKRFMYSDPGAWNALLEKISRGLVKYLNGQIANGADAVQIFDSWAGCLGPEDYRAFVLPHTRAVIRGITPGVPVLHFGTGTGPFLRGMREAGGDAIGVDWRLGLDEAWAAVGHDRAVQGNLDPAVLCSTPQVIREHVKRILDQAGGRPGHIFNLGHGILPQTPEENAVALIEMVHEMSSRSGGERRGRPRRSSTRPR